MIITAIIIITVNRIEYFFGIQSDFPKKIIDFGWEIYEDSDQKCNVL